jgi:hypothetical protein
MSKYSYGVWMLTIGVSVALAYNVNVVTGICSAFMVWGIAYMITGTLEGVLKAVFNAMRSMKE